MKPVRVRYIKQVRAPITLAGEVGEEKVLNPDAAAKLRLAGYVEVIPLVPTRTRKLPEPTTL